VRAPSAARFNNSLSASERSPWGTVCAAILLPARLLAPTYFGGLGHCVLYLHSYFTSSATSSDNRVYWPPLQLGSRHVPSLRIALFVKLRHDHSCFGNRAPPRDKWKIRPHDRPRESNPGSCHTNAQRVLHPRSHSRASSFAHRDVYEAPRRSLSCARPQRRSLFFLCLRAQGGLLQRTYTRGITRRSQKRPVVKTSDTRTLSCCLRAGSTAIDRRDQALCAGARRVEYTP